jgi:ribonuclease-3
VTPSTTSAVGSAIPDPPPPAAGTPTPGPSVLDVQASLADRLAHRFTDPELLVRAMAHRSWVAESPGSISNERLEFLGDAVLGLIVTDHIYRAYPSLPEGELAKVRASVVSAAALAEVADELALGDAVLLGRGEDLSGGREKPSILADALEAVIGAVYIDGGWEAASTLVFDLLGGRIVEAASGPGGQDYKTRLQELAVRVADGVPVYAVRDEGPDHAKRFHASVQVGPQVFHGGEGRSRKQAEQAAARSAWEALRDA